MILILMNFRIFDFASSQVVLIASLGLEIYKGTTKNSRLPVLESPLIINIYGLRMTTSQLQELHKYCLHDHNLP